MNFIGPFLLLVFASTAGAQTAPDSARADTVPVALPGVVASGWRIGGSAQSLSRADWRNAPQPGEDVFRMVTRLPGVSADDLAAKFAVRGGSNDELLVRLDGLELVEPFHLREFEGGALSLVDMEALGSVELIPGGFPARYGNRLTGVFDMRTAALPAHGGRTVVGLSLTNARVLTHQGFAGGKGEWLFSARRGYLDLVLEQVDDAESEGDRIIPRYGDALAKVQYRFGRSHVVSVHGLYAGDQFRARDGELEASTRYGTLYGWMNWRAQLGERLIAHTVLSVGDLSWDRSGAWDGSRLGTRVSDRRDLTSAGARQEWSLGLARGAIVRWGWEWKELGASYDYSSLRLTNLIEGGQTRVRRDSVLIRAEPDGRQLGAHLSAQVSPWPALTVEAGARGDRESHTDEVSWSPRLNLGYALGPNTSLRGAWGVYHQPQGLQSLQVQDGVSDFFPAERAEHRVVGIDHEVRGVAFRAEAYQRLLTDVRPRYVSLDRALDIFPEVEDDRVLLAPERGEARGVELFAQRSGEGRVRWWAGYALARIRDEYDGRATPRDTDQRHTLNLGTAYVPGSKWRVSAAWRFHSGLPITARNWRSGKLDSGGYFVTSGFGQLYGERLPAYHRLDARVTRNWQLRNSRVSAFLDVFNAYNRENARAYSYSFVTQPNGVRVDRNVEGLLPILPSIGVAWEF
ncbi:MAG TPA: TonB-dependent receptor plug domain-containing protein [Longimicrobium sp.]|nr:TonB-dependent receptor plug domain-containing protein [Longimicrobium sp.]